jgi:murein DD-endopeptidase MepM/ murein hydrolase activator NlpD
MEQEMFQRNDVTPSSKPMRRSGILRVGYCLSGLSLLSGTIAQAQTNVPVQLSPSPAVSQMAPQAETATTISIASPEALAVPEVAPTVAVTPSPAALEVPAATVEPSPVAEVTPSPVAEAPSPATAPIAEVVTPKSPAAYEAPEKVIFSERGAGCETTVSGGAMSGCGAVAAEAEAPKSTAAKAVKQAMPATKAEVAKSKVSNQPPTIAGEQPVEVEVVATQEAQQVAEAPAINLGPISLSSSGISLNPGAIPSYFNPSQFKFPTMPSFGQAQLLFPVAIPAPLTSMFGWRIHPISGAQRMHTGTDIGAPMGAPVLAAMPGRVILADNMGGYGITVAIEHDNGMRQTLYAHMSELFVRPGDIVQQGAVIGRVGSTGASTGPHLHFELRQMLPDGTWVALDSGKSLEQSMANLMQSLQLANQPQKAIAIKPGAKTGVSAVR